MLRIYCNKKFLVFASAFFVIFVFVLAVQAGKEDIVYPVKELGNCKNETQCFAYCDQPKNIRACVAFAKKNGLMNAEEANRAEKFTAIAEQGGPGGCKTEAACRAYCDDVTHINECLEIAEQFDVMRGAELEEAKKIAKALKTGAKLPGGCKSKESCMVHCEDPKNSEECIAFAEIAGFMTAEEAEQAKKFMPLIARGESPGKCKTKETCEAYCLDTSHMEECLDFAAKTGIMSPEELEAAQKILPLLKSGQMPGGCRSRTQCEDYCEDEAHFDECIVFAEKAGFISLEDAEMAKKVGKLGGPGGCRSKEACEEFCDNPENQEACFEFAVEHGFMSEDQIEEIKEQFSRLQSELQEAPLEVRACLEQSLGADKLAKLEAGKIVPDQSIGPKIQSCFEGAFSGDQFQDYGKFQGDSGQGGSLENGPSEDFEEFENFEQDFRREFQKESHQDFDRGIQQKFQEDFPNAEPQFNERFE